MLTRRDRDALVQGFITLADKLRTRGGTCDEAATDLARAATALARRAQSWNARRLHLLATAILDRSGATVGSCSAEALDQLLGLVEEAQALIARLRDQVAPEPEDATGA